MRGLKISISKLAEICGVSHGTVDRALHDREGISPETKERILKTAGLYGFRYVPNKELKNPPLKLIGVVLFNLNNEYFAKIINDIQIELKKRGYLITVMFSYYDKKNEIEIIRNLYNMGVEGLIICPVNTDKEFGKYLNNLNIPVVTIGNNIFSVPYVGIDDYSAMKDQTEEILKAGYKNIIYFSPAVEYEDAYAQKKRYEGFIDAVSNRVNYSVVTDADMLLPEYDSETLILCSTDYYAVQVYFKTKGAVIVGFDNIDLLHKFKMPIHSVTYDTCEIGRGVVNILLDNKKESIIVKHKTAKIKKM